MAQSTTNLGKIHVFPSESLYNQFKDIIADNDLALLKDDGAYIVAALLEQNGYVKFSNGLILQWGYTEQNTVTLPIAYTKYYCVAMSTSWGYAAVKIENLAKLTFVDTHSASELRYITIGV